MSDKLQTNIAVFAHPDNGAPDRLSLHAARLITLARSLTDAQVEVVAPASVEGHHFAQCGADIVHTYDSEAVPTWQVGAVLADIIHSALAGRELGAILLPSDSWARDAIAQLAIRMDAGASVDVTALEVRDGRLLSHKSVLDGTWETKFNISRGVPIIGMRSTSLSAEPAGEPSDPQIRDFVVKLRESTKQITVISDQANEAANDNLTEAPAVVCGGRGTHGNFELVRELASVLGGAVGATRTACEEGWIDRSAQIGQSGIAVAPNLYVGLGVSGDLHHVCGIRGAGTIVAVCDDPEAAIFQLADFGVVGDLNEVVAGALEHLAPLGAK